MFGNTLVLPLASGNVTLVKVNQDAYASEYLFRDTTKQYTVRIRHSALKAKPGERAYERHNVEVVRTVFGTAGAPDSYTKAYFVMEQAPSDTAVDVMDALADWAIVSTNANLVSLLGKES